MPTMMLITVATTGMKKRTTHHSGRFTSRNVVDRNDRRPSRLARLAKHGPQAGEEDDNDGQEEHKDDRSGDGVGIAARSLSNPG